MMESWTMSIGGLPVMPAVMGGGDRRETSVEFGYVTLTLVACAYLLEAGLTIRGGKGYEELHQVQ